MPKKVVQDIIATKKRTSHRHTPKKTARAAHRRRGVGHRSGAAHADIEVVEGAPKVLMWGLAFASVVFLVFVLLSVFSGATVKVTPTTETLELNKGIVFSADKNGERGVPFRIISLQGKDAVSIPATEEKEIQRKASGKIVVYNEYSSQNQKLIKRTRFESPDGKIYRINKSIIVPGTTVRDGKIVPGSVETVVYADMPGEEYNIGLVDFTIPGFKGGPRYDKFYARSKTPMEGGFSGTIRYATDDAIRKAEESLSSSLKETLVEQARGQVPDDFILYDDALFFEFSPDDSLKNETTGDSVKVGGTGKLYGVIFNKSDLANYIAKKLSKKFADGDRVSITKLEELAFAIKDKSEFNPKTGTRFAFSLAGSAHLVWDVDTKLFAEKLRGRKNTEFDKVVSEMSGVETAVASIRPFWKNIFPDNAEDILIKVNVPGGDVDRQ